jgi:hypothetical protein
MGQERRFERASATSGLPPEPTFACAALSDATGRLCCKSRFALMIENSAGYRRGFRVKM